MLKIEDSLACRVPNGLGFGIFCDGLQTVTFKVISVKLI